MKFSRNLYFHYQRHFDLIKCYASAKIYLSPASDCVEVWNEISQNLAHLEGSSHKNSILRNSRPFYNRFYEININHTLLWFSQASYLKKKKKKKKYFRLYWGSSKVMFKKISQNFCQKSFKILLYLTDFSPQLMACMVSCFHFVHLYVCLYIKFWFVHGSIYNEHCLLKLLIHIGCHISTVINIDCHISTVFILIPKHLCANSNDSKPTHPHHCAPPTKLFVFFSSGTNLLYHIDYTVKIPYKQTWHSLLS